MSSLELSPSVRDCLDSIARIVGAMTADERDSAARLYAVMTRTYALHGADVDIPGALVLGQCIELLLIAGRDAARPTESEAI